MKTLYKYLPIFAIFSLVACGDDSSSNSSNGNGNDPESSSEQEDTSSSSGNSETKDFAGIFSVRKPDQKAYVCNLKAVDIHDTLAAHDVICTFKYEKMDGFIYMQGTPTSCEGFMQALPVIENPKIELYMNGAMAKVTEPAYDWGGNHHVDEISFVYDGKKIVTLNMTSAYSNYDYLKMNNGSVNRMERLLLENFMPYNKSTEKVIKDLHAKSAKGNTNSINLTWDGDNVSKITATTSYGNATMTFSYDDKNNPYKGFLMALGSYGETEIEFFSKNNITKSVSHFVENGENYDDEETYTYTYDGKWPLSRTEEYSYEDEYYHSTNKYTTYFEYK